MELNINNTDLTFTLNICYYDTLHCLIFAEATENECINGRHCQRTSTYISAKIDTPCCAISRWELSYLFLSPYSYTISYILLWWPRENVSWLSCFFSQFCKQHARNCGVYAWSITQGLATAGYADQLDQNQHTSFFQWHRPS